MINNQENSLQSALAGEQDETFDQHRLRPKVEADLGDKLETLNVLLQKLQQYITEMPHSLEKHAKQLGILIEQMNVILASAQHLTAQHLPGGSADLDRLLLGRHPLLSSAEIRVCRLVIQQLDINTSAQILGVKASTIKKHRSNIRQKIGLAQGENLARYLATLEFDVA